MSPPHPGSHAHQRVGTPMTCTARFLSEPSRAFIIGTIIPADGGYALTWYSVRGSQAVYMQPRYKGAAVPSTRATFICPQVCRPPFQV